MDAVNAARALRASKTVRDGCGHRRLARGGWGEEGWGGGGGGLWFVGFLTPGSVVYVDISWYNVGRAVRQSSGPRSTTVSVPGNTTCVPPASPLRPPLLGVLLGQRFVLFFHFKPD